MELILSIFKVYAWVRVCVLSSFLFHFIQYHGIKRGTWGFQ